MTTTATAAAPPKSPPKMGVSIRRADDASGEPLAADLLEITTTEIKLQVATALPFGEPVVVQLRFTDLEQVLDLPASVWWLKPLAGAEWFVRCKLDAVLNEDTASRLATRLKLERRRSPRYATHLPATAHWEADKDWFEVVIKDVSSTGCSILSPQPGAVGKRLLVQPAGDNNAILVKIQWQTQVQEGYRMGCEVCTLLRRESTE